MSFLRPSPPPETKEPLPYLHVSIVYPGTARKRRLDFYRFNQAATAAACEVGRRHRPMPREYPLFVVVQLPAGYLLKKCGWTENATDFHT